MPSPGSRRLSRRVLIAMLVLLLLAGGAVAFVLLHSPGNVSHPNVEFTGPTTTQPAKPAKVFAWPRYGYDAARTRYFASGSRLDPPFRVGWRFEDFALLEFPPVIYGHTLYLVDDDGSAKALDARTGHKLWERKVGTLAAASPALGIGQGLLFVPILSIRGHTPGNGRLVALSMKTGRIAWSHAVAAGHRVLPAGLGRRGLLRRPGRQGLLAAGHRWPRQLDLPRQRRGQGRPRAGRWPALLRRLLRPRLRPEPPDRPQDLGRQHEWRRVRLRQR